MTGTLAALEVTGSGLVAGVLFAVWLSVLPGLIAMPPDRYVYAHQVIGGRWDPTMPILVLSSAVIDLLLFVVGSGHRHWLFGAAGVVLIGVSIVSHFCNVPINRQVKTMDAGRLPSDWRDPRPTWRRWHTLRTALSVLALLLNAIAAVAHW
jgi:uncharacterized membrane protein